MCVVIPAGVMAAMTIASTAAAIAGSVSQYQGQRAMASAQAAQNAQQADNIRQATLNNYQQAQQQEGYHNQQAYQKLEQSAWNARSAEATALTSAGDNGVDTGSLSVGALAQEYQQRQSEFASDVEYNRQADINTLQEQMQGFQTQGESQLNSLKPPTYPSAFGAGLSILGDIGQGVQSWNRIFPAKTS